MNARAYLILNDLNSNDFTLNELSEKYGVSIRTIRYDINNLNKFLKSNHVKPITISKTGKLILNLENTSISKLLEKLDFDDYKLSQIERKILIAYILLMNKTPVKVSDLASILSVSRATINNDLEEVKADLRNYNLRIESYMNRGLKIFGNEEDKRRFILHFKDFNVVMLNSLLQHIDKIFFNIKDNFSTYNREIIIKLINEQLSYFNLKLSDSEFSDLVDYIELLICRNKRDFYVNNCYLEINRSDFAETLYNLITQYFELEKVPSEEDLFNKIASNLTFIKVNSENKYSIQIQFYTRKFISRISDFLNINLRDDFEFYENLSNHLNSIQNQENLNLESNKFIEEIIKNNPEILEAVRQNIDEYEYFIERKLTEIEIYYIVIHICAALERKSNKNINLDVILICNAGIGTTKLIQERLKKHFNFNHIQVTSLNAPISNELNTIILSTINLEKPEIDYIKITPLLNDEDLIKIGRKIETIHKKLPEIGDSLVTTAPSSSQLIKSINKIILNSEDDVYGKLDKVDRLLTHYFDIPSSGNPRLIDLLTKDFIKLDINISNLYQAVREAGKPLLEKEIIGFDYINSCISVIENYGPYMFIGENFFLAHSNISSENKAIGFSLIRLKEPLELDNGKTIKWISMMSALDREKHLKALFTLGNLVQDSEYMKLLEEASSPKEIENIIRDYEYLKHPVSAY